MTAPGWSMPVSATVVELSPLMSKRTVSPSAEGLFAPPFSQLGVAPASHVVAPAPPRHASLASTIGGGGGGVMPVPR